jgi:hypothetical protein
MRYIKLFLNDNVFWVVAPCISCVKRRFEGTHRLHLQGRKIRERGTSVRRWQHTATSQKTVFFKVTAVKTSKPTKLFLATELCVDCGIFRVQSLPCISLSSEETAVAYFKELGGN